MSHISRYAVIKKNFFSQFTSKIACEGFPLFVVSYVFITKKSHDIAFKSNAAHVWLCSCVTLTNIESSTYPETFSSHNLFTTNFTLRPQHTLIRDSFTRQLCPLCAASCLGNSIDFHILKLSGVSSFALKLPLISVDTYINSFKLPTITYC